jgi:hypothetical protein
MSDTAPVSSQFERWATLRRAVYEAYEVVQKAQEGYAHALEIAHDTNMSSDGMLGIKQQGREYAYAVTQYSNAVMAWLSFMDAIRADANKTVFRASAAK